MSAEKIIDIQVSADPFDSAALYQVLENRAEDKQEIGAVASFVGKVRQMERRTTEEEQPLVALAIEHYPAMTETALAKICEEARLRWPFAACIVRHRVGTLNVGEDIVLVMVASSHRKEAFAACEFIMDYLKTEAPFWKKAIYANGEEWIAAKSSDAERRKRWEK